MSTYKEIETLKKISELKILRLKRQLTSQMQELQAINKELQQNELEIRSFKNNFREIRSEIFNKFATKLKSPTDLDALENSILKHHLKGESLEFKYKKTENILEQKKLELSELKLRIRNLLKKSERQKFLINKLKAVSKASSFRKEDAE